MSAVHSRQSAGGFEFLNSELSQVYYRLIDESIQSALTEFNDEGLKSIHAEWQEVSEFRENTMIENIYKYSEHNDFQTGVFLIGSYHLKSITEKIKVYDDRAPFNIFWKNLSYICS